MKAWLKRRWYDCVWLLSHPLFALGWSYRMRGRHRMPATGPVLVLANHQSFFDPLLVGVASTRHLTFLARKTLFRKPGFAAVIRSLDAVPIDQEGLGKDGLQAVAAALAAGKAVLVFPEGERAHTGELGELKAGVLLLIRKAKCPIVPVGIAGAFGAWPRTRKSPTPSPLWHEPTERTIAVSVGEAIDPRELEGLGREEALGLLRERMAAALADAEELRRKSPRPGSPESCAP